MGWIIRSSDAECAEERVAGGKGASLARLRQLGAKVPPFIVVSAQAYRDMAHGEVSDDFIAELRTALLGLNLTEGVAVRSSALGEDAAESSFAGLYHTSLDVRDFDSVVEAIRRCWTSYENEAAAQYREGRTAERDGAMAVVIMEMVHGDWSGVSFTANPVNLALSEAVINAVPGLGEALVSGEVNPEEIVVSAADGRILSRRAGERGPGLPEPAVTAVWRTAKELAEKLEFPQDVEWAWRDGELFILQSRPITTIADVYYSRMLEHWKEDPGADPDNPKRVWSRMLADETWVSPISPLFYNVHNSAPGRAAFIRQHGDKVKLPPDIFKYHRATAYCDVRIIKRMYEFQPRIARIRGVQNFLPRSMQEQFVNAPWRWRGRLRRVLSYEFKQREMRSFFRNYKAVKAQWPAFLEKTDRWLDLDLDALSLEELRAHQADVAQTMAATGPACAIAVLSHATDLHLLLTGLLDRWCKHLGSDGENLYARISSGLDESETVKEAEEIWQFAQAFRALGPDVVAFIRDHSWAECRERLSGTAEGRRVAEEFEAFWRGHRHTGSTYKDLIWPRWGDDIDACFAVVKGQVESVAERPSVVHARSANARRAAQQEILSSLKGPLAPFRRRLLRFLFRYNEIYMAERDNHRFYYDRNWYEMRRIYRSYGKRLVDAGVLRDKDEVFFLGVAEVEAGLKGELSGAQASKRIDVRRKVWETTLRKQGPKFLKGWAPLSEQTATAAEDGQLRGIAASPGSATATARVVYDVRELAKVKDGEILVTRQTDPAWTTVFGRIAGLVLETGGVLSHGTSLCREYGLPCVTSVEQATVRIPDGARIELHGSEGTVRVLSAN